MKKISTLAFAVISAISVFAQTRTLQPVNYRGAFEPGAAMWTAGWTEFDPQNQAYSSSSNGSTPVLVTASITKNTTWTNNKIYTIRGPIYVKNGATLTIQPGTVIKGDAAYSNSCLIISKGSKINAQGTVNQPIVFTSSKASGTRAVGDWGGVIILGNAKFNGAGGVNNIEGLAASADNQYGGNNDDDNSGVFSYCRIEFGGYIFTQDKEINGLTLGAVGRKTKIDHVQASFINDDAFEWFGGTVNCTHLFAYRCVDDDFDTDNGFSGTVQFCLSLRDRLISDQSSGSTSEGMESDGEPAGTDSTITPKTNAVFSNITIIGPYRNDLVTATNATFKFRRAMRIRRNSNLRVFNSVFTDFQNSVFIDGDLCAYNSAMSASNANSLAVKNNVFASMKNGSANSNTGAESNAKFGTTYAGVSIPALATWFTNSNNSYQSASNGLFVDNITSSNYNMDYRPATGSVLESGATFSDAFIEPRTRIGLGALDITGDSVEIAAKLATDNVTITCGNVANADNYVWTVPAGITVVSGQGTTSLTLNFPTNYNPSSSSKKYIYCYASNSASATVSTTDSIRISRNKPTFKITAIRSNANNGFDQDAAAYTASLTSGTATTSNVVSVSSTAGLKEGMIVKILAGTGAGAWSSGVIPTVTQVINGTSFQISNNPSTAIASGATILGINRIQGTTTDYVSAAGASNSATLVTVASTTGLKEGMILSVSSGTGSFKAGTVVAKIVSATQFISSLPLATNLDGVSSVVTGRPLLTNTCDFQPTSGSSVEYDYSIVATPSNILGYRFDVPKTAIITRVGSNSIPLSDSLKFVLTSATSIGVVYLSNFTSGSIKATPYNNAGNGTAFSISVKKTPSTIYKVVSSGPIDTTGTPVIFTASLNNGMSADTLIWTVPGTCTVNSGVVTASTASTKTVVTTGMTISLSFAPAFKSGSIAVKAKNNCGVGANKSFSISKNTSLLKNGQVELQEIDETESIANSLAVYPNPSNGTFTINMVSADSESDAVLTIVNMMGQVVSTQKIANQNGFISAEVSEEFENGIYFVSIEVGSEKQIRKISINR